MRVRENGSLDYRSFLKFVVLPERNRILSGVLHLRCTDGSSDGGTVFSVGDEWSEPTLSWTSAPELGADVVGALGPVTTGTQVSFDLGQFGRVCGRTSLGLRSSDTNSALYSTREGTAPPELELTLQPWTGTPSARFEANRTSGFAPLMVQFFDASNGPIDSYLWDFGDGTTSNVQNPSHAFRSGIFTVRLTVSGPGGTTTRKETDFVQAIFRPDHGAQSFPSGRSVPAPVTAAPGPRDAGRILEELAVRLERRFPASPPPLSSRSGRALVLATLLAGPLDDVRGSFDEILPEAGLEILACGMDAAGTRAGAFELRLRGPASTGALRVVPRSGGALAVLTLEPLEPE